MRIDKNQGVTVTITNHLGHVHTRFDSWDSVADCVEYARFWLQQQNKIDGIYTVSISQDGGGHWVRTVKHSR